MKQDGLHLAHGLTTRSDDTIFYSSDGDTVYKNTAAGMRSSLNFENSAMIPASSTNLVSNIVLRNASGDFSAGVIDASGQALTSLNASNVTIGTISSHRLSLVASDIPSLAAGKITSGTLGTARIPSLDADKITSGTLGTARIPSLDADKITSGTFDAARIPSLGAGKITSGTFDAARIPSLGAGKITSGTFGTDRIPSLAAGKINSGTFGTDRIPSLAAGKINSGTFDAARIPTLNQNTTGTANYANSANYANNAGQLDGYDSSQFLRSDINTSCSGYISLSRGNAQWRFNHYSNSYLDIDWKSGGWYSKASISPWNNHSMINFTGQHRTFIKDIPFTVAGEFEGLIVSADQNKYIKMSGGIEAGSNAITTNESLPVVSISTKVNDKKCFGVISASEDPETRKEEFGNFVSISEKELGDTRVYVNSVGEGAIWVTNINGPLESGDYITTSNVAGYGMKQDSEFLANYTVAKITMDCDFAPATQPIQTIKKELGNVNYWVETTYSDVSLEEYSNLAEENRQTVTTTRYSNEEGEISLGEYSNLESNVQTTYSEIETATYKKIEHSESTTEREGHTLKVREELVNVLNEHGQLQWEDHPTETEKTYKIRYLTSDGQITDKSNAIHIAAFVGCTYHCG